MLLGVGGAFLTEASILRGRGEGRGESHVGTVDLDRPNEASYLESP